MGALRSSAWRDRFSICLSQTAIFSRPLALRDAARGERSPSIVLPHPVQGGQATGPERPASAYLAKTHSFAVTGPCQPGGSDPAGGGLRSALEPRALRHRRPPLGQGQPRSSRGETALLKVDGV